VARGYSSLEYDVDRGVPGRRDVHAEGLICRLTGAEAAVVVNNNAAATMIVLAALAAGGRSSCPAASSSKSAAAFACLT
jgi:L-seryl-tRNA(Ser) seleniumtransferase